MQFLKTRKPLTIINNSKYCRFYSVNQFLFICLQERKLQYFFNSDLWRRSVRRQEERKRNNFFTFKHLWQLNVFNYKIKLTYQHLDIICAKKEWIVLCRPENVVNHQWEDGVVTSFLECPSKQFRLFDRLLPSPPRLDARLAEVDVERVGGGGDLRRPGNVFLLQRK